MKNTCIVKVFVSIRFVKYRYPFSDSIRSVSIRFVSIRITYYVYTF
jgi:hypothetical protein